MNPSGARTWASDLDSHMRCSTPQSLAFVISVGSILHALTVDGDDIAKEESVGFIVEEKIGPVGLSIEPASEKGIINTETFSQLYHSGLKE